MVLSPKANLAKAGPLAWLLLLTTACLAPFLGKAFHIDDTLFLRAAEQIQRHPLDFYGFQINWSGVTRPMVDNFDNPPLACYYIALAASIAGWSEPILHLAFLLPALAAVWGVLALARHYCKRPGLACLVAILTPVFIISATNVMCDVLLVAFWVWAVVLFEKGLNNNRKVLLLGSGVLIGLAFWTKFSALALIPLLAAYGLCRARRIGWWVITLLVPLVFVAFYEYVTWRLYGRGLLLSAASFSSTSNALLHNQPLEKETTGLSFMGGCFLPVLFYAPWLWSRRNFMKGACILAPLLLLPLWLRSWARFLWGEAGHFDWIMFLQGAVFIAAGIQVIALASIDFWTRRDAPSLLLALWVIGIFVFATRVNWTINGRSFMPMLPAVGILVARRFEQWQIQFPRSWDWQLRCAALGAGALCLFLAVADSSMANQARSAARNLCAKYLQPGRSLWFEGHWGFQFYMERQGAKPFERTGATWSWGDLVVIPADAVNFFPLSEKVARPLEELAYSAGIPCATMSRSAGAGFYASVWGPFPYSFNRVMPRHYSVLELTPVGTDSNKSRSADSHQN
jgi:4-amino-4-deoxy-L-arabinose transferase-like glycosyltransferase